MTDVDKVVDQCVHAWKIETPAGPTSDGTCSGCGETRSFTNTPPHLRDGYKRREEHEAQITGGRMKVIRRVDW